MADSAPLPENSSLAVANSQQPSDSDNKTSQSDPSPAPSSSSSVSVLPPPPPPPSIQSYSTVPPSFRPATPPAPVPGAATPLFSPLPNPNLQQQSSNFQNPAVQPPGVSSVPPGMNPAPTGSSAPQMMQPPYGVPGQLMRPYAPMPNGYTGIPQPVQPGAMPHHVS